MNNTLPVVEFVMCDNGKLKMVWSIEIDEIPIKYIIHAARSISDLPPEPNRYKSSIIFDEGLFHEIYIQMNDPFVFCIRDELQINNLSKNMLFKYGASYELATQENQTKFEYMVQRLLKEWADDEVKSLEEMWVNFIS